MEDLILKLKNKEISQRSFISTIKHNKNYISEVELITNFLNDYKPDILERLYYIINDIHEIVKCKYCDNKAKWSGRINDGYKTTCCSKECESKRISEQKTGQIIISKNRENNFIEWQNNITNKEEINDNFIKNNIKYDKFIDLLTNKYIIDYLKNRFNDSNSLLESYQRIQFGIEEKPKCPFCGKPVNWIGKKTKLYTVYCSDKCSGKSLETIQKKKQTQLKNWGTENCYDSEKYKNVVKEKFNVEYFFQSDVFKEKRKDSLIKNYGTTKLFSVEEIRNKIIETTRKHYGVDYIFQSDEIRNKMYEACKIDSKFQSSKRENKIYEYFLELGYKPERFYKSDKFPFCVDFYLKEYDLYIEYQGSQYHNGRAFLGLSEDLKEIEKLKEKHIQRNKITNKNTQYNNIINVWAYIDVKKRNIAYENNINYLEIYCCNSKDDLYKQLNYYLYCYNKKNLYNYDNELLKESYNYYKQMNIKSLSDVQKTINNILIKHFQGNIFYAKEMEIYATNPILRRKLIQNRCKFLNKKENELSIDDIFGGFKKSGIFYGYSHFNPGWTNWFVNHYNIKTIFDPCGGWGHHMLGMLKCDKIIYNDVNTDICNGVREMKEFFSIDNLEILNEDIMNFELNDNVDAWFMCPPYFNIENYGNVMFKDIDDYKAFLNNIFMKWYKSSANIFGLIIREDFYELLDDCYKLQCIERHDIKVGHSHLVKRKKFNEYFYIFRK